MDFQNFNFPLLFGLLLQAKTNKVADAREILRLFCQLLALCVRFCCLLLKLSPCALIMGQSMLFMYQYLNSGID